jgi:hypothetical protein
MLRQVRSYVFDVISIVLVICISAAGASYNISKQGIDTNEAIFLTIGSGIAKGSVLYKDLFDLKTPFDYFWLSWVAPNPSQLIYAHYAQAVVFVLSSLTVFVIGKKIHGTLAGLVAALLVCGDPLILVFRLNLGPENWLNFFGLITLACLLMWVQSHSGKWLMLAGATAAAAFWSEQFGAVVVILVFLTVIWHKFHETKPRIILHELLTALAGMLILSAPFLAYFVLNNATTEFIQSAIRIPLANNAESPSIDERILNVQNPFHMVAGTVFGNFQNPLLWPLFLLYLIITSWRWCHDRRSDKSILLIIYSLSFYLAIIAYWPSAPEHMLPLIAPLAMGAASLMVSLFERQLTWLRALRVLPSRIFQLRFNLYPIVTGIFLLSIICVSVVNVPSSIQKVQAYELEAPPSALVTYIDNTTSPNQRILVLASPSVYYFSQRQPAITHFFLSQKSYMNIQLAEIQTAINKKSAVLVVVDVSSDQQHPVELAVWEEVVRSAAYHMATRVGKFVIHRLYETETSTVVFVMYDSQGKLHSEGSVSLSGLGSYPTDGHTPVSIPNGRYTITANIPSGYVLSRSTAGAWTNSPNTAKPSVEFSNLTMNPTNVTLSNFQGTILVYIQ